MNSVIFPNTHKNTLILAQKPVQFFCLCDIYGYTGYPAGRIRGYRKGRIFGQILYAARSLLKRPELCSTVKGKRKYVGIFFSF